LNGIGAKDSFIGIERRYVMPYITVGKENSGDIELYYEDHGSGNRCPDPRISIERGFVGEASTGAARCGLPGHHYDRRGFGKSSQPTAGYNYDTFAEDLTSWSPS